MLICLLSCAVRSLAPMPRRQAMRCRVGLPLRFAHLALARSAHRLRNLKGPLAQAFRSHWNWAKHNVSIPIQVFRDVFEHWPMEDISRTIRRLKTPAEKVRSRL